MCVCVYMCVCVCVCVRLYSLFFDGSQLVSILGRCQEKNFCRKKEAFFRKFLKVFVKKVKKKYFLKEFKKKGIDMLCKKRFKMLA